MISQAAEKLDRRQGFKEEKKGEKTLGKWGGEGVRPGNKRQPGDVERDGRAFGQKKGGFPGAVEAARRAHSAFEEKETWLTTSEWVADTDKKNIDHLLLRARSKGVRFHGTEHTNPVVFRLETQRKEDTQRKNPCAVIPIRAR